MIVRVRLLAFGQPGEIREVDLPEEGWDDTNTDERLDLVFYFGQNDFQPQRHPSVSVGDVIELGDKFYIVKPSGFGEMTPQELDEYEAVPRRDRLIPD